MNRFPEPVALVPSGVVTVTLTLPKEPAGEAAVICVAFTTVTFVAAVPSKLTAVAPVKPVPVIVTVVPPVVLPLEGLRAVTVGAATVAIAKLLLSVEPLPALPAASCTPVISRVITFVASVTEPVGVKVAVHVTPPFMLPTEERPPLAIVRSALLNPVTASLKVIVTVDVSPTDNAVSETTKPAVGGVISAAVTDDH